MKVRNKHKCKQIAIQRKTKKCNVYGTRISMLYISGEKKLLYNLGMRIKSTN